MASSLGLWISSEDGTEGSTDVRDNVSSEPVFADRLPAPVQLSRVHHVYPTVMHVS